MTDEASIAETPSGVSCNYRRDTVQKPDYLHWHQVFTNKAKGYPINACRAAINDCHKTLKIVCPDNSPYESAYATKLWAEIDAMRERIAYLATRKN